MSSNTLANGAHAEEGPPADSTMLDADPEIAAATQEQGESMQRTTSTNRAGENGTTDEMRQEALDLNTEETRLPLRKDTSMREFLSKMDDYAPVIPDAVTFHALALAGLKPPPLSSLNPTTSATNSSGVNGTAATNGVNGTQHQANDAQEPDHVPLRLARLIALATQKFVADIATDAYQYSRMRTGVLTSNSLSVMANPGGAAGAAGAAGGAGGPGAGSGPGAAGASGKGGANAHVLGIPRAGFGGGGQGGAANRAVLTMEDLGMALGEYGVNVKRGEFYR